MVEAKEALKARMRTRSMRFFGQRYDSAAGLYHTNFQDYDPAIGRYVQSDPPELQGRGGWGQSRRNESNPVSSSTTSILGTMRSRADNPERPRKFHLRFDSDQHRS
jgi:RHS repeat-associated protein